MHPIVARGSNAQRWLDHVIDGRENLAGAEQFMRLNQLEPEIASIRRRQFPSESDEEAVAAQVVQYVRAMVPESVTQAHEAIGRVEAELIHFCRARTPGKRNAENKTQDSACFVGIKP
jgi:hypothetical protein